MAPIRNLTVAIMKPTGAASVATVTTPEAAPDRGLP
jgi:hypothetical protein